MAQDFIIGVIGDFSGAASAKPERFLDVDRDDFDEVFARLAPVLELGLPFCERLELRDWEDWGPDGLLERVPMLAELLDARGSVGDAARMRERLARAGVSLEAEPQADAEPSEAAAPVSESDLLDDLLAGPSGGGAPVRVARHVADPAFERLIAEIAEPHAERIDHAGIAARRAAIDGEIGARTRTLLGHPVFRAREALWRSLRDLVFRSETGEGLRIRILDAAPELLRGDDSGPLSDALHRLIVTEEHGTRGGRPFGLLLVDVDLAGEPDDLALLGHLGRIADEARLPCLVGATPALWRPDRADAAKAFLESARALPGADRIGLCAPRLLVRVPYGRAGEPVDRFSFEEVDAETDAEGYTWGPAGFAVARAAAESVAETGSAAHAGRFAQREGLPFQPGATAQDSIGPTEQVLSDSELERLKDLGLLPVAGVRGRDTAVIVSLGSLTGAPLFAG